MKRARFRLGQRAPRAWAARLLGLLALVAGTAAVAQNVEDFGFGEVVTVQLVNVEVWVTDGKGVPVSGLAAEDFEILEDGKPVEITYFAEVEDDRPKVMSFEREAESQPFEAPQTPNIEPSHLVIYFDQLHLRAATRNRVIEDLQDFLVDEKVAPERVLLLSQEETLKTEVTFGSSWPEIDEALSRLAKTAPAGDRVATDKRLAIRNLQLEWQLAQERAAAGGGRVTNSVDAACDVFLPRAVPLIEAYARESQARISVSLDHLASVASFLTGVPGVKTLLYVSDALERAPGADLVAYMRNLCPTQQGAPLLILSNELGRNFARLTRHANTNRVTIYSLQSSGLATSATGGAENRSLDFRGAGAFDSAVRNNERDGMSMLAAETGGRTIFNRNDFGEALDQMAGEMTSYYSLAYEPKHGGDGGEHEIQVRLESKGLKARHRRGYRDKSPDERMAERLDAAVFLGLVDNSLGVRLAAGTLRSAGGDRVTLPLHVLVPTERITFVPGESEWVASLSVQLSTRNTRSLKGLFEQKVFRVPRPADPEQETIGLVMDLEVPAGVHLVAVGLRDDATLESSFISTTLELNASVR